MLFHHASTPYPIYEFVHVHQNSKGGKEDIIIPLEYLKQKTTY